MPKVIFKEEMKKEYTILIPNMLSIHFRMLCNVLNSYGYNMEILYNQGRQVVDEGLKYVHNDTCYPALLVIGQFIDALKSGKYDLNKTALMITQTGGGCRASNYIALLRKALDKAGFGYIPVLSLNFSGLEKDSALKFTLPMIRRAMAAVAYGDLLMLLHNQVRPYEVDKGESEKLVDKWCNQLCEHFRHGKDIAARHVKKNFYAIAKSFAKIKKSKEEKIKVGIVGEIYVKYAALGNNNLEEFLYNQGCETMVPGVFDFLMYCVQNNINDYSLYGGSKIKNSVLKIAQNYLANIKNTMNDATKQYGFTAPDTFEHLMSLSSDLISNGCKMGEGWLLTSEMMELSEMGYENIICVQPFGCLPNHIVGKGMIRSVKNKYPKSNIVPIDYDPGATVANQENRIKLMLSVARENKTTEKREKNIPVREKQVVGV